MKKILIIEDDPVVARVYGTKYSASGFETMVAPDGETGVKLVDTFKPDIVHLDLLIPKLNGVEVIKRLRSRADLQALPIVVLSNTYQNHLVRAAMDAGATECVSKATCTPKMMLAIMEKFRDRTASPRVPDAEEDLDFHREFRRDFQNRAPQMIATLRGGVEPLLRAETDAERAAAVSELCRSAHSLAGQAGIAGFVAVSEMSSALVSLLRDLIEHPRHLSASVLRTIVDATDSLSHLLDNQGLPARPDAPPFVLVVDDEELSRRALVLALGRIHVPTVAVHDPHVALQLLEENRFSLILLDVGMPAMNGFDLCRRLRALPANAATPVVFVTAHGRLEDRQAGIEAGGNDLIAKPFLPMELAVKALSLLRTPPKECCATPPGLLSSAA